MNNFIYLASRYSRFKELQGYKNKIETLGFKVTSRWIEGNHQIDDEGLSKEAENNKRIQFAEEDVEDLCKSDIVICFTEIPRSCTSRGGRHVEMGMALALGKTVIVVGYRENVFCCLPDIIFVNTFQETLNILKVIKK